MANTASAKKAIRSSARKRMHNNFWKKRIKVQIKTLKRALASKTPNVAEISSGVVLLQKLVDKASKEKVIHKNRANRLKSKYAQKLSELSQEKGTKKKSRTASAKSSK